MMTSKTCNTCNGTFPLTHFAKKSSRRGDWVGYQAQCNDCAKKRKVQVNSLIARTAERLGLGRGMGTGSRWSKLSKDLRKSELAKQRELDALNGITPVLPATTNGIYGQFEHEQLDRIRKEREERYRAADEADKRASDGFVYVMVNDELHPGLCKIGKARDPDERARTANAFDPKRGFRITDAVFSNRALLLEGLVQRALKERGLDEGGEWFEINQWHAINLIHKVKREQYDNSGV